LKITRGFLITLFSSIALIGLIYFIDVSLSTLRSTEKTILEVLNFTTVAVTTYTATDILGSPTPSPSTYTSYLIETNPYSSQLQPYLPLLLVITIAALLLPAVAYGMWMRRR